MRTFKQWITEVATGAGVVDQGDLSNTQHDQGELETLRSQMCCRKKPHPSDFNPDSLFGHVKKGMKSGQKESPEAKYKHRKRR